MHLWLFLLGELTDVCLVAIALYTAHLGQIGGAGDVVFVRLVQSLLDIGILRGIKARIESRVERAFLHGIGQGRHLVRSGGHDRHFYAVNIRI